MNLRNGESSQSRLKFDRAVGWRNDEIQGVVVLFDERGMNTLEESEPVSDLAGQVDLKGEGEFTCKMK